MSDNPASQLPPKWYTYVAADDVCEALPGIYEWHVDGAGSYIGEHTHIGRPTREYGANMTRLLNNQPYRPSNKDGFRHIHRQLASAHLSGAKITLTIRENVAEPIARHCREKQLIAEVGALNRTAAARRKRVPKRPREPGQTAKGARG